jgi:membrane protease YdiL (CAAX protease family)
MTAISAPVSRATGDSGVAWRQAGLLVAGLAAITAARWAATRAGLDPLAIGAAFGLGLLLLVRLGLDAPWGAAGRPSRTDVLRVPRTLALGIAVGLLLIGVAVIGPGLVGPGRVPGLGRPAVQLVPWALVTVLVACAEEAVLRGALFDRVSRAGGIPLALALTTTVFALLHAPLYGWHVVPLDLAVGVVLGGLRLATHSVTAPAAAHAVADLATWWL